MTLFNPPNFVTPAEALIHPAGYQSGRSGQVMGPRLRRGDDFGFVAALAAVICVIATPAFAQGTGPTPALANQQLDNPAKEAEATRLMHSLRCIQCQGQSIADSDAAMAATMRAEVRQQIGAGEKPETIRQWMIDRYGQWVSFEPEMKGTGLLLWAAPLLLLALALWLARGMFRKRA